MDLALIGTLLDCCHAAQLDFVADSSPRVAACCSRRAGKSVGVLVRHAITALRYPGEMSVYIGRSVAAARDVLEPAMRALQRSGVDIQARPWSKGRTYWRFPNGHRLWLAGCNDRRAIDDFRGTPFCDATIDEAQQVPFLTELLDEAIEPALLDFQGWLALIGTPSPVPAGLFFEATQGNYGWKKHHWTALDNPFLGDVKSWLEGVRLRHGWTAATPRYRREYLGEWVLDGEALVYPLTRERNGYGDGGLPAGTRARVLGVDLGSSGTTALVVVTTVQAQPGYWVEHCETARGLSVSDVCERVRRLSAEWSPYRVVVDAGGLGGAYVHELQTRHHIAATAAKKTEKLAYIEHLRSDILAGLLHVRLDAQELWDEAAVLQWEDDRQGYDDRLPDHCLDALLYAWRSLLPERERIETPPLVPGSPEWMDAEARRAKAQRARLVAAKVRAQRRL